jgi:hypothetical protein
VTTVESGNRKQPTKAVAGLAQNDGRAALLAAAIEGDAAEALGLRGCCGLLEESDGVGGGYRGCREVVMCEGERFLLEGAALNGCGGTNVLRGSLDFFGLQHAAVVLAVSAATGGYGGVRCQRGCDHGEQEGTEQKNDQRDGGETSQT